jgi:hypothetical protein
LRKNPRYSIPTASKKYPFAFAAKRSFDFGFWILDFGLTPRINPGASNQENFSFSPQLKSGVCIHIWAWSQLTKLLCAEAKDTIYSVKNY